ncbi:MAG: ABC transporter ATP-binding protein [Ruminococcus sp.]
MWKYIKKYLPFSIVAAAFMIGEVLMDLIQPELMSKIVDEGVLGINNNGDGQPDIILSVGLVMIILVIFGGLCGSLNNVFVNIASQNIGNNIRKDCFRKIMTFSFSQTEYFGTGSLVTRVTNDITQVETYVAQFVRGMVRTFMLTAGSIFFMFCINVQFGLIVLCAFPFVFGCIVFCLCKANPLITRLQSQLDKINEILQEDISGIRIIKACVREIYEKVRFGKANNELIKTQLKVLVIFAFMNPIMNALMYLVVVIVLFSGSVQVDSGTATAGTIMAAITYITQMFNGILGLVMLFQSISKGIASWKRIKEILDSKPLLKDGNSDGKTAVKGKIEFRDVSFAFPDTQKNVLSHINLVINPGETIAVMGATGSGKSVLVSLITRFYDVSDGSVLVDDVDIRDYRQKDLRDKIAFALQKSELFSISLKENISLSNPDATDGQIHTAAKIAQADEFISRTPNGYDTVVAERGMNLSGGQKQRISIARAILKPAEILIFDDSTSALDLKTEADLYSALNEYKPDNTKIIIAQRIATVRRADRIILMDNGQISACGTHSELLKSCKLYQDIYYSQIESESYE